MYIFYILNDYNIEAKDNQKNEEEMEREETKCKSQTYTVNIKDDNNKVIETRLK